MEIYHRIFEYLPDAVLVVDRDGCITRANSQAEKMFGYNRNELIGQTVEILIPLRFAARHVEHRSRFLAQPLLRPMGTGLELFGRRKDGTEFPAEISLSPLRTDEGLVVSAAVRDISARKRVERRVAAEYDLTRVLAESAELGRAAPLLLQGLCENLGWDVGLLWTVDSTAQVLRCVAVWHTPTVAVPEFERVSRERTFARGIGLPGHVWANRRPVWVPDVARDDNFPQVPIAARKEGLHAACAFPIHIGVQFLGVMEFFSREIHQPNEQLLGTMASIGSQISQFIERRQAEQALQLREHEFALARQIQQGLFPVAVPELPGFAIAGASQPAQETGGDYWDAVPLPGGRFAIAIGDASGVTASPPP